MESTDINRTQIGADIFAEFLEVSIHTILYNRGIYPEGVFERRKKYNVPVQMCLHPDVVDYITKVVDGVKVMVESGEVNLVTVVIVDKQETPLERFVFELDRPTAGKDDKYLFRLEESLRAFLLKLNLADALLKPLPSDCSWAIQIHTKESVGDKFLEGQTIKDFTWVPAEEQQICLADPTLVPLKTMATDILKMQLFVEESASKNVQGGLPS